MKSFKKLFIISLIAQGPALYAAQMGTLVTNALQSAADSFLENPTAHVIGAVAGPLVGAVGYMAGKHIVTRRTLNAQLEHALTNNGSI